MRAPIGTNTDIYETRSLFLLYLQSEQLLSLLIRYIAVFGTSYQQTAKDTVAEGP